MLSVLKYISIISIFIRHSESFKYSIIHILYIFIFSKNLDSWVSHLLTVGLVFFLKLNHGLITDNFFSTSSRKLLHNTSLHLQTYKLNIYIFCKSRIRKKKSDISRELWRKRSKLWRKRSKLRGKEERDSRLVTVQMGGREGGISSVIISG